ncbi:SDR family oxidoreductase [Bacillus sp. KH172YL63]|uniref:SDR family oxidoreductase n=1 Tax=Bacillus sp. KH172YL63 TaxID=2709784 RepID=UPI0013E51F41|nr:SDR family oxidoreductase [Bacillus sp. KH172YL63]BCB03113.1 3-beta hydroxysteroid dehydrogenase [Bacillus sp. KH172YL63]
MGKGIYFITGFPGFLSFNVIEELLKQERASKIYLLHVPAMAAKAKEAVGRLMGRSETDIALVEGDITEQHLGLSEEVLRDIRNSVDYVWHLAAIYDLAVPEKKAYKVNVEGTRHVNDFCASLRGLKRYVYFSTAFIAGERKGVLREGELLKPNRFHNFYEQTKYEAEVLVENMKDTLPVTIIRPGIVKGNSATGETVKFDGPYFIMNMFMRLSFLPWIPFLGGGESVINIVPVEYVVRASVYLGHREGGEGKTYHLTDPEPITVKEVYEQILWHMLKKKPKGNIPLPLSHWALGFRPVRRYLRVEKEALDYFSMKSSFDCSQAQRDLQGTDIRCPSLSSQVEKMVAFYLEHSSNEELHVKID